ncbi:MAG: tRNA-intron lyase [Candidatus Bathyarchaeia archaeon]
MTDTKSRITAELTGERLIVWDFKEANDLYRLGFYGKPVGIPKPKPGQEFQAPLVLDLMEGAYLLEKRIINIVNPHTGLAVKRRELQRIAEKTYMNFKRSYTIYKDMREKGYVVTPGIKFGSDFAVYERGPGIDHAPFIISVRSRKETMGPFDIVRAGRLATTVRKQFIIATPKSARKGVNYFIFRWFKA